MLIYYVICKTRKIKMADVNGDDDSRFNESIMTTMAVAVGISNYYLAAYVKDVPTLQSLYTS